MSNTKHTTAPHWANVDYGLGLCLGCLGEVMAAELDVPRFAITLAPMLWPPGARGAIPVGVPACWLHVQDAGKPAPPRNTLLAATRR